jgi:lysophospholipase L1-like esterase
MKKQSSRRFFLKTSALAGIASVVGHKVKAGSRSKFLGTEKGLTILFQGDSITDGNRGRNEDPNHIMGHGYAFSIASRVGADFPTAGYKFYNRGTSGNTITDLKNRWQQDTLDIKPDVLSVLVGINDAALLVHKTIVGENDIDKFENTYRQLLQQSKDENPGILLVLCLPFVFANITEKADLYAGIIAKLKERVKRLSLEFNAVLVDFSPVFEKAIKQAPVSYWIWDGIHPTVPAHELMAREWIKQVSTRLGFLKLYDYH